jgi:AcrR family transcriptional regulator
MARPKEFQREIALQRALAVFSDHGYEGTSTDALLAAMGISRQSMYDTFGDKWRLYLEALQHYTADSIGDQLRVLNAAPSAIKGIAAVLDHMTLRVTEDPSASCLGIGAICEFGRGKTEITMLTDTAHKTLLSAFERRIAEAKAEGDIKPDVDVGEAAGFLAATLIGIRVSARGGASVAALRGIARMALRSLT